MSQVEIILLTSTAMLVTHCQILLLELRLQKKNQKFNFCITVPRNINDKRIALAVITHCRQILKLLNNVSLTPYCK